MTLCDFLPFGQSRPPKSMPPPSKSSLELAHALRSTRGRIQKICEISGVAGLSISVIHNGKTLFKDNLGHRDIAKKKPVTSDTVFHIASLTKSFTGVCINQLRAGGKLSLNDPIQKHLPEAKSQDPVIATTATIADLLGHRTGLQKADNIWLGSDGKLLFDRGQTVTVFNQLRAQDSLRSRFLYNNIGYAILGEIIAKVAGQPYHVYLKEKILDPLNMTCTIVTKDYPLPDNSSLAYSTLDNGRPYEVPLPGSSASVALGSTGGLLSSVNDLEKYYKTLMSSWHAQDVGQKNSYVVGEKLATFNDVSWICAPLQIMDTPAFREKSYASGWARSQLPTTIGDIGVNPGLVDEMPLLAKGVKPQLALWHQGSLVGATSFVMLLPETESAVIVLTNTMAFNDAADWIGQFLVETLLNCPMPNDYVRLACESAGCARDKYADLSKRVEEGRKSGEPNRALREYIGTYIGIGGVFAIDVVENENGLEVRFQGRKSQGYQLQYHHKDTFTWFMSWNEQIKRARFIGFQLPVYFIYFKFEDGKGIIALNWVHDSAMPGGDDFIKK